ncbi:MAG: HD domain-containing protein [Fidelibacterota bacterium]|nr:MAG: HD domain-containing protein [Candidatus Neomarinimicrobiota bacterium]
MKLTAIHDFQENSTIQGFYLCLEKHLKTTKAGDYYLDLLLQDATGRIQGKIWDRVDHFRTLFETGDPLAVKGIVEKFGGALQLNCTHVAKATKERYGRYGFHEELLIPTIKEDRRQLWKTLISLINGVKDKNLKALLRQIFKTYKNTIMVLPASTIYHHPERGGFLLHLVSTGQIAILLAKHYPRIEADLLLAGVLLHDIGKVRGMSSNLEGGYTDEGQLIGHLVLSRDILREAIQDMDQFPPELALKLEHMVISHQGSSSEGSPRPPKFPEALLVHYIDRIDGRLDLMFREIDNDQDEDAFTDSRNPFRTSLWKHYRQ